MKFTMQEDTEKQKQCMECLQFLSDNQVDVGLTSKSSARSRFLMAIHENGSPIMHIPPRPVIKPALSEAEDDIAGHLLDACEKAQDGDMAGVIASLEETGQAGVDAIHRYIDSGVPPPNSPVTISGGWIYNRVAKVGVYVSGKGGGKPLYATGALYSDFSYEIVNR